MSASCCLRFQSPSKAVIVYVLGMERFSSKTLLLLTISALALFIIPAAAVRGSPEKGSRVFLQKQLPLTLIVTTPSELSDSTASTFVSGRQALTAVFSRPVIALGSDFGQPTSQMKVTLEDEVLDGNT
ncbi:hypothetical protein VOLCADRAFT_99418 [Volvox carteri f. nagariensis]|uniref:Uncharacterized protein n=1 Tax=Volvox carteri f. nagariensis TaxID=3068 RepID=D8UHR5_VOLCA|nr:uncharacterized protein VOLCADRAFT_99418 [Volvox carteri f. nagariensis]EFJ40726.1 hypothetical protein VOLCADRAFT_99418 [Volvox carteri f. nagariensis]|eukprot:XP_002958192.1 hypothetical protein VOLCADRAFT_99418 [Volvox carteri f. nagariensis]